MKTIIITGASKGLGAALAERSLAKGDHVILIARSSNPELKEKATQSETKVTFMPMDLSETKALESFVDRMLEEVDRESDIWFINNAGVVEPIKQAGDLGAEDLELSMKVNFLAPVILADAFIKKARDWKGKKVLVNISSGAAKNPYHGWSAYCSTKAGLEMFTRTAGLEQEKAAYPISLISFSPGIMDTGMQATIRSADQKHFTDLSKFQEYKEKGQLRSPSFVAEKLIELLEKEDLENGKFYDIKELV